MSLPDNLIFKTIPRFTASILLIIAVTVTVCSCDDEIERCNDANDRRAGITANIPLSDLISPEIKDTESPDIMSRIWVGLFGNDGKLKETFSEGNGIYLNNESLYLQIGRGIATAGDILAILKHTEETIKTLDISNIEKLRELEYSCSTINNGMLEVLYGEKELTTNDFAVGGDVEIEVKRPYATIEITDIREDDSKSAITSVTMKLCPESGRIDGSSISKVANSEKDFNHDETNKKFWLNVPAISFASNSATSSDREILLTFDNEETKTIYITKHKDGKPVDIEDPEEDNVWKGLLPGYKYSFTYKGSSPEEEPTIEIKDKIRIKWYKNIQYGKFAAKYISVKSGAKTLKVSISHSDNIYYIAECDITGMDASNITYQMMYDDEVPCGEEGNLLKDTLHDKIINTDDGYTTFILAENYSYSSIINNTLRFYCRDISSGNNSGSISYVEFQGNSILPKQKIEIKLDPRGYKYSDLSIPASYVISRNFLNFTIYKVNGNFDIMDYYYDIYESLEDDYSDVKYLGINLSNDVTPEVHDGVTYQCFYFN